MSAEKPLYHEGSCAGYSVEARAQGELPQQFGEQIFDNRWRTVQFERARWPQRGVPTDPLWGWHLDECGLYAYHTAQALRHWLHAEHCTFSLETRLVEHKVHFRVEWQREGERDYVGTWPESTSGPTVEAPHG